MAGARHRTFVFVLSALVLAAFGVGLGVALLPGGTAAESAPDVKAKTSATRAEPTPPAGLEGWVEGVVGKPVVGSKVVVGGWAADRIAGAPVTKVEVQLDGKTVATANLGVERADVAKVVGRDSYAKSGWNAVIDLSGVAPGKHQVGAVAYGASGAREKLRGEQTVDVAPAS